jgi:hypothetical protein
MDQLRVPFQPLGKGQHARYLKMSPTPEAALKMGDALRTLVPDAGHLIHMPTHIDVLCGHYQNVVQWNVAASKRDLEFFEREGAANIYTGYRQHNYHFTIYGAMFLGQMEPALAAVRGLRDTTPEEILRIPSPPMADFFESYLSFEPHVWVRFGRWRECTELPLPEDRELYCTLTAFTWYARALGHAANGGEYRNRTGVHGFAIRCVTTPPTRRRLCRGKVLDMARQGRIG